MSEQKPTEGAGPIANAKPTETTPKGFTRNIREFFSVLAQALAAHGQAQFGTGPFRHNEKEREEKE